MNISPVAFFSHASREVLFQALTGSPIAEADPKKFMHYMLSYLHMNATCNRLKKRISALWLDFIHPFIDKRMNMSPQWLRGSYPDMKQYAAFHPIPVRWMLGDCRLLQIKVENISLRCLAINQNQKLEVYGIWPGNTYELDGLFWREIDRFAEKSIEGFKPLCCDEMFSSSHFFHDQGVTVFSKNLGCYGDWLFLDKEGKELAHILGTQKARVPKNTRPIFVGTHCFILFADDHEKWQLRCYRDLKQQIYQVFDLPFSRPISIQICQRKLTFTFVDNKKAKNVAMASLENLDTDQLDFIYSPPLYDCSFRLIEVNGEVLMVRIKHGSPAQIQRLLFNSRGIEFAPLEIKDFQAPIHYIQSVATLWDRLYILGKSNQISSPTHLFHINLTTGRLERETTCRESRDLQIKVVTNPQGRVHFAFPESNQSFLMTLDFT